MAADPLPVAEPPVRPRSTHRLVTWLFLRALGLIYLIAFVSLWVQIRGLVGTHGILPVRELVASAGQYFDMGHVGLDRYRALPTLAWWGASDAALVGQCAAGAVLALLLTAGVLPGYCLVALWALYVSLSVAGQDFLSFQWDSLLTEAGFLAIFIASWRIYVPLSRARAPSVVGVWLVRWLGFRLMFASGLVKLLSGDPTWRSLAALTVHYQTQPLPTWIGWYAHHLPAAVQTFSCAVMFGIELGAPWLLFAPRIGRALGCAVLVWLQVLILLTGNYGFFNWLTIALCLMWLDDAQLMRLIPARLRSLLAAAPESTTIARPWWRPVAPVVAAVILVPASLAVFASQVGLEPALLAPARDLAAWAAPFRTVNTYGLFAVMTTTRDEIVIEGSDDQVSWQPYAFRYKPGDLRMRPAFVAPYQPRLDWQMWFAALGTARANPWFTSLCVRLLQGTPEVVALLASNPFPNHPPRFIRANLYEYRFTSMAERRATGEWWTRTLLGPYFPVSGLKAPGGN